MKVAIVYDRVNKWGGAERVLLDLQNIFPKADLITSVHNDNNAKWARSFKNIKTSFLQKVKFARNNHEYFSLFMPLAFEGLNLKKYDLVISVTSESAKGIITSSKQKHICILLTPTRYLWSGNKEYFSNKLFKFIFRPVIFYLKKWDITASRKPDTLVAISKEVQRRIKKYYNLDSILLYPAVTRLNNSSVKRIEKKYYLLVSRLVSYKKVDLAIHAFNKLNKKLIIIGSGRQEKYLKSIAKPNITFLGRLTDSELANYYESAKALIFPQKEDFGLTAIEAQTFGTPVIAYRRGGALETVIDNKTGVFFDRQNEDCIIEAVQRFEKLKFNKKEIIENASRFSFDNFKTGLLKIINNEIRI